MVNPRWMCRQHLLGEHLECHMFHTAVRKGQSLDGYIQNGLLEVRMIKARHDTLVEEMLRRGYNHHSPMDSGGAPLLYEVKGIDVEWAWKVLSERCPNCRVRKPLTEEERYGLSS